MNGQQTTAGMGDLIGFFAVVVIVIICLVLGLVALIRMSNLRSATDRFSDDFIPDRATVAETQRHLPKMPRQP